MNVTIDPCEDFYDYVCGGWIKNNPIPINSSVAGMSTSSKILDVVDKFLKMKLENGIENIDGVNKRISKMPSDLYQSCINLTAIERTSDIPLQQFIQDIGSWSMDEISGDWNETNWEISKVISSIHRRDTPSGGPLFSVTVTTDPVNSSRHIIEVM
jgi:predicted metalloendopeptidase